MSMLAARVKETTTTTGTGTLSLGGAVAGYQTFVAGIGDLQPCYYTITEGNNWEVGIGTVTDGTPDTLSRTTILASSNAGAALNLAAGTKDVFVDAPAQAFNVPSDNPIINGNMEIWQRGTTFTNPATATHSADRWIRYGPTGATVTRSTNAPTVAQAGVLFNYSYSIDVTTADLSGVNLHEIVQKIEGYNWRHFAQRDLVISFWIRSTKTGIYSLGVVNNGDRYHISEYTINTTNTWEYKTITIPASPSAGTWDYTNGIGLLVRFGLVKSTTSSGTVGAWTVGNVSTSTNQVNAADTIGNIIRLTGVKLELGSVANPIQFVPFEVELARAKRYYQKSFPYATAPAQNTGTITGATVFGSPVGASTAFTGAWVSFGVQMRASTPSMTFYNPMAANAEIRNDSLSTNCTISGGVAIGENGFVITGTTPAATVAGHRLAVNWTVDAEL